MAFRNKTLISVCAMFVLCDIAVAPSSASTLSAKQQLMRQLQAESSQTAQGLSNDKRESQTIHNKISNYQSLIDNLNQDIVRNQQQLRSMQQHLDKLNQQVRQSQAELERDEQDLVSMLRGLYESGDVSYIEVLFKATSWDDLLSRIQSMTTVTKAEDDLVKRVVALHKTLAAQTLAQKAAYQALRDKNAELASLQQVDKSLQNQQKNQLAKVNQQIQSATGKQVRLQSQIRLTQSQMMQLEQQVNEAEAVLSTNASSVTEPELRFQNIQPLSLYHYVHARNSTFTLQDMGTICQAAQKYDVNPALLVAITGQEEGFVPPGPDAARIRNNPFNVFYSWQVYNTNLADSAAIAADTLRHKLSVRPPAGEDAILWINDSRNPWGIYATDQQWAYNVRNIFNSIMKSVSAG